MGAAWLSSPCPAIAGMRARVAENTPTSCRTPTTSCVALPGIGDYTASAVLSFAFGERIAVIDTNIRRVLSVYSSAPNPSAGAASPVGTRAGQTAAAVRCFRESYQSGEHTFLSAGPSVTWNQSGDGTRRDGVHCQDAAMRGLPDRGTMRVPATVGRAWGSGVPDHANDSKARIARCALGWC